MEEEEEVTDELLKQFWYNPLTGFTSPARFAQRLRAEGYKVNEKRVRDWLKTQEAFQVTSLPKKPKVYNSISAPYPGANYQVDIMHLKKFKTPNGYKFILVVIDVASRKLGVAAMRNRKAPTYAAAWEQILDRYFTKTENQPVWPASVSCDREFINEEFVDMLKERGVNIWYSQPHQPNKNAIVERVIRTIRGWLAKWRVAEDDPDWAAVLPDMCFNYNQSVHRTLKQTPQDVWMGRKQSRQVKTWVPAKRKVGEKVRVILRKPSQDKFRKTDVRIIGRRVYTIASREPRELGHRGFKWVLADSNGDVLTEKKTGEPVYWLDYELVPVPEGSQDLEQTRTRRQEEVNNIGDRIEREDIDVQPANDIIQLGYIPNERVRAVVPVNIPAALQPARLKRTSQPVRRFSPEEGENRRQSLSVEEPKTRALTLRRKNPVWPRKEN